MILVAGGTGALGSRVALSLARKGEKVRVLARDVERSSELPGAGIEVVKGDVLDPASLEPAVAGVQTVVSAVHGFNGSGDYNPRTVDAEGNRNLIHAASAAGVQHFILVSIHGVSANHPTELFRMKFRAEEDLRASGMPWTILRPTAYMETWMTVVGEPLLKTGATKIFGRGQNPINFVSVDDVARFVELAITDPAMKGGCVEIGGPENLTMLQFVETFKMATGAQGKVGRIPRPMMRLVSVAMRPFNEVLARHAGSGVVMDTSDMRFDPAETVRRFPSITPTPLAAAVRRAYAGKTSLSSHQQEKSDAGESAALNART